MALGKMFKPNPPTRWVTVTSVGLLVATASAFLLALVASDLSYWLWSRAGIASSMLLVVSPLTGLAMIGIEKYQDRRREIIWPALLVLLTGLPLLGLVLMSFFLRV